ncbi:hypothetical protein ACO0SA_004504 [Hanseniaspora valbyensis]
MDAFFKPKIRKSTESIVIDDEDEEEAMMIDPDLLILNENDSNDNSIIIINEDDGDDEEENKDLIVERKPTNTKQNLKQLLSGSFNNIKKSKTEIAKNSKKLENDKLANNCLAKKKSRSNTSMIISKEVEIIEMPKNKSNSSSNSALKNILIGRSSPIVDKKQINNDSVDIYNIEDKVTVQTFFQQNKLKRFHPWSSKKTMDLSILPETPYINNYPKMDFENNRNFLKTIDSLYHKRRKIILNDEKQAFNYNSKVDSKILKEPAYYKKKVLPLTTKLLKEPTSENWTEKFKPQTLEEMSTLLPLETIQTFKYQLQQSFVKLAHKSENDRELLQNNWKSLLKNEQNENSDDDFIVDEDKSDKVLEHIPLFIIYGSGIGKNLLLELTLKELEKEGMSVNNILEINSSMERSKKNIFDTCFEAATTKFLQTEDSSKNFFMMGDKRKQQLSDGVLLFDEVDNLFSSDKIFYPMLFKLLQVTKKPIILTCNFIDCIPEQLLKITDFQQTNFLISLPETTVPFLNQKLGLRLSNNDRFYNVNRDIRQTLNQLQLDRCIEIKSPLKNQNDQNNKSKPSSDLIQFAKDSNLLSQIDNIKTGTLNKSCIKQGLDYTITDFIESETTNDDNGDEECDYSSQNNKIRLDGTINYFQWANINHLKRPYKNFYDENTFNERQPYEIDIGGYLENFLLENLPEKEKLINLDPKLSVSNKSKLTRNLYLKLEYMQLNMLPYNMKLSPTRSTINEYLENLQTSDLDNLITINLRSLLNRNYQILDNKLNYEFTNSRNLFCYHYPFFRILFQIDFDRRIFVKKILKITFEKSKLDNIQTLKHLMKEKAISNLIFDEDPRIYWNQ